MSFLDSILKLITGVDRNEPVAPYQFDRGNISNPQGQVLSAQEPQTNQNQLTQDYYSYAPDLTQPPQGHQQYVPQTRLEDIPRDKVALEKIIESGLAARGNPPISQAIPDFAEAGSMLPANMNPLLPVIMSIIESGGGKYIPENSPSPYNTFNIYSPSRGGWAKYNDYRSSLFGNNPEENVNFYDQMVEGSPYEQFRNTGRISDLFRAYTPETDDSNPRNYELIDRYNMIMDSLMGKIQP